MLFIPVPFVAALLLALLFVRQLRAAPEGGGHHLLFLALLAAYALQSVLIGLRWGYEIRAVLPVQAMLAALIAPLAFLAFRSLTGEPGPSRARLALHLAGPPALTLGFWLWLPGPLGPFLIALFLAYGLALAALARRGPDALAAARLDGALRSYRALLLTAGALIGSALTDIVISLDFDWNGGRHTPAIIALFNLAVLLALGAAAAATDTGAEREPPAEAELPAPSPAGPEPAPAPEEAVEADAPLLAALEALMEERRLYTDPDLDLSRLARRLGVPARRLSQAINRGHGVSVSHYVNALRIAEAQRLLADPETTVTRAMMEAGFLTKSNFNREFRRLTGASPSDWRARRREQS